MPPLNGRGKANFAGFGCALDVPALLYDGLIPEPFSVTRRHADPGLKKIIFKKLQAFIISLEVGDEDYSSKTWRYLLLLQENQIKNFLTPGG